MSTQIDRHLVNQFSANVQLLAQQKESRLVKAVRNETLTGEFGFFDQWGAVEPVERVSRHADTPFTEVPAARRRVFARDWENSDIIDVQDTARMLSDPNSKVTQAFAAGMARMKDRVILNAAFATADTGKSGATSVAFPAGQQIAVDYVEAGTATNSSMTMGKIRRARELLINAGVEDNELYIACGQREISSLLRTLEVTSSDFNQVQALMSGSLTYFMGFNWLIVAEPAVPIIPVDGSSNRRIAAWHMPGLLYASVVEPMVEVAPDPTKGFSTRIYMRSSFGATRMEEARVVEIKCHPTTF
jgi:hypothetical protein